MRAGRDGFGVVGCVMVALLAGFLLAVGGYLMEYVVETAAAFFGKAVDVPMPHAVTILAGAILSEILIPLAVVVWLLGFVL